MFKSDQQDRPFYERMWTVLLAGQRWEGVLVNKRKDGSLYEERCAIGPVYDANGTLIAYVSVKHDLTHQRLLEANLQRSLRIRGTALMVMEGIERQATAAATATTLCESIVQVSGTEAMVVQVRADGSIAVIGVHGAALGGMADVIVPAEFAATYVAATEQSSWVSVHDQPREPDSPSAIYLASKGFTATAQSAIRSEGRLVGILSLATRAEDGAEWMEDHLALADELGSFASVLLGSQIDAEVRAERSRVEIEAMIAEHRFHTVFQPYVDLITREVKGYEALTRFDDGTRPDVLITAAWAVGVGAEVEIACARAALDVANQVMPGVPISLNFSPQTILRGDVADVVTRSDEPLVIEVTEHTEISDYPALRDALQRCGQIKVSVDDAGAGFASMRHILELHPDVVKLDIGLIRGIDVDLGRQALAAGLCHYAAQTGTLLIAEGIETAEEAEMARTLGVHYGQGYFFGRPARVD
jgi:EAL domain-containing protein (putative c-di-GMP-specific phosphodiesterase class I)